MRMPRRFAPTFLADADRISEVAQFGRGLFREKRTRGAHRASRRQARSWIGRSVGGQSWVVLVFAARCLRLAAHRRIMEFRAGSAYRRFRFDWLALG